MTYVILQSMSEVYEYEPNPEYQLALNRLGTCSINLNSLLNDVHKRRVLFRGLTTPELERINHEGMVFPGMWQTGKNIFFPINSAPFFQAGEYEPKNMGGYKLHALIAFYNHLPMVGQSSFETTLKRGMWQPEPFYLGRAKVISVTSSKKKPEESRRDVERQMFEKVYDYAKYS